MSRRIAIVEDEAAIRENYADVLRKQGYEVQTYSNRLDAMTAFNLRLPNLAIIEIITSELTALVARPVACALPPLEQINQKIKPAEDKTPELIISMYEFLFSGSLI